MWIRIAEMAKKLMNPLETKKGSLLKEIEVKSNDELLVNGPFRKHRFAKIPECIY